MFTTIFYGRSDNSFGVETRVSFSVFGVRILSESFAGRNITEL
jgi:hypothetical protein